MIANRPVAEVQPCGAVPTAVARRYWREFLLSYVSVNAAYCEQFAPVVDLLAGH